MKNFLYQFLNSFLPFKHLFFSTLTLSYTDPENPLTISDKPEHKRGPYRNQSYDWLYSEIPQPHYLTSEIQTRRELAVAELVCAPSTGDAEAGRPGVWGCKTGSRSEQQDWQNMLRLPTNHFQTATWFWTETYYIDDASLRLNSYPPASASQAQGLSVYATIFGHIYSFLNSDAHSLVFIISVYFYVTCVILD